MAVALKIGVGDLVLELLTHTLGCLRALQSAGAVPAVRLRPSRMVLTTSWSELSLIFMFATSFIVFCYGLTVAGSALSFCDKVTLVKKIRRFFQHRIFKRMDYAFHRLWRLQ